MQSPRLNQPKAEHERYTLVMDENLELFLVCVGYDYHCQVCAVCNDDGTADMCPEGDRLFRIFISTIRDWSYRYHLSGTWKYPDKENRRAA